MAFVVLVIIALIIIIKMIDNNIGTTGDKESEFESQIDFQSTSVLAKETNRNKYYAAVNISNKFFNSILYNNNEEIYNMLEPNYIQDFDITEENVLERFDFFDINDLSEYEQDNLSIEFKADNVYNIEKSANMTIYFIYGKVITNIRNEKITYNLIVEMDSKNNTFYILPEEYMKKNGYIDISKVKDYNIDINEIEENIYNTFEFINIEDYVVINDYLSSYQEYIVDDISKSYDLLDLDYRSSRFGSYEEYEQYIKENIKDLLSISISKYKVNEKENYNEYIFIDKNNNYYIFREKAIMDYTLMLDTYTIDSQEFLDKYEKVDDQTKVGMNVQKIVQALNLRDYKYIYNKLDENFRNNNFSKLEEFKQYMKQRYPLKYTVEYNEVNKQSGIYIQPIVLTSISEENIKIESNFILKLKEGTDFVMSFPIE